MRLKIQMKPCFSLTISEEQSVVLNYREKYNQIDLLLQNNPDILDTLHDDLKDFGSENGRDSHYSSEQILRMAIVQVVEGLDYRSLVIRVSVSDFLRNFTGIGVGKVSVAPLLSQGVRYVFPRCTRPSLRDQRFAEPRYRRLVRPYRIKTCLQFALFLSANSLYKKCRAWLGAPTAACVDVPVTQ